MLRSLPSLKDKRVKPRFTEDWTRFTPAFLATHDYANRLESCAGLKVDAVFLPATTTARNSIRLGNYKSRVGSVNKRNQGKAGRNKILSASRKPETVFCARLDYYILENEILDRIGYATELKVEATAA